MTAHTVDQIAWAAAIITCVIAAITDLRATRIPNWLTLASAAMALLFSLIALGLSGLISSVIGLLVGGAVMLTLFIIGEGGGGDVKLYAALGAWLFWSRTLEVCVYSFFAAALYALTRLAWEGKLGRTLLNSVKLVINVFLPKSRRKEIDRTTLEYVRLGPPTLAGILVAAWLHFNGF